MNKHSFRPHGLTVLFSLKKHFWVLLIPVLRAAAIYGLDLKGLISGFAADIAVISLLLCYALTRRLCAEITVNGKTAEYKTGLLIKKSVSVNLLRASCISLSQNLISALFDCFELRIYLSCSKKPVIKTYCTKNAAALFCPVPRTEKTQNVKRALLRAAVSSDRRGGLLFLSASLSVISVVAGGALRSYAARGVEKALSDIPRAFMICAALPLPALVLSFAVNFFREMRFSRMESGGAVIVSRGTFGTATSRIAPPVTAAVIGKSAFFGRGSLYLFKRGYGEEKYGSRVFAPFENDTEIRALMYRMLPPSENAHMAANGGFKLTPPENRLSAFTAMPLFMLLLTAAALVSALCFSAAAPAAPLLIIPLFISARAVPAGVYGFYRSFAACGKECAAVGFSKGFKAYTAFFPYSETGRAVITQSPFQRAKKTADIRFCVKGVKGGFRAAQLEKYQCDMLAAKKFV